MVIEKDLLTLKSLNDVIAKHNLWVHNLRFRYTLESLSGVDKVLFFKEITTSNGTTNLIIADDKQYESFSTIIHLRSIILQNQYGGLNKLYVSYKSEQLKIWGYDFYIEENDDFVDLYIDRVR